MREDAEANGRTFTYIGIPLIGQGYPSIFIKGTKAILAFVPLSTKGHPLKGPAHEPFLHTAAVLLCMHDQYPQTVIKLGISIAGNRSHQSYGKAQSEPSSPITTQLVAQCLAMNGVSAEEAESWRPWAATYVEMELNK